MDKQLTPQEIAEQELADKITPLILERLTLEEKRGNGCTLEKNWYIGDRTRDIEKEESQLKEEYKNLRGRSFKFKSTQ